MIPHISRILSLWRIAAYYRLDNLVPLAQLPWAFKWLCLLIRLHPASWLSRYATSPMRVKLAIESMGPLFIKLGQLLSTRRDLIPPELLVPLAMLQDQVKPFDVALAKARIENALQQPMATLFSRFDDMPLAAASIAQIHTAAMHDGREVVVKIVRPHIREQLIKDFEILDWVALKLDQRLAQARAIHLPTVIHDYRQVILNELDLSLEADNTRQFKHNFTGSSMMYVPEIYADSKDVLIAERISGVPVSDIATFERLGMDRALLAERGLTIFFTQVFRDNFFHADMHPGNVFVETLNPANPRYISLDCAIVGQLSDSDRLTVARLLLAVMQSNFTQLIHIVHLAGWIPPNIDQGALARDMKRSISPMIAKPMDQLDFAGILMDVMDIARHYQLEIPSQLVLLLKTLVHVEGLGRDLYPALDIWKLAKPILTEWIKGQMNPAKLLGDMSKQLPDLLLGVTQLPKLLLETAHGFKLQRQLLDKQYQEIQNIKHMAVTQQRANWVASAGLIVSGYIVAFNEAPVSYIGFALIGLTVLWRISR